MGSITFTLPEIIALLGVAQCIYILIYMLFRSGRLSRGSVPAVYFSVLGLAFLFDAAARLWAPHVHSYDHYQWLFWFAGPPLSMLLIVQIARITALPSVKNFLILLLIPAGYIAAKTLAHQEGSCNGLGECQAMQDWLIISGCVIGGLSLLIIWTKRGLLSGLLNRKGGQERYWLIMALIILNLVFLADMLALSWGLISEEQNKFIRICIGIAFAYTASTSLLRIYPQAMRVENEDNEGLSDKEIEIALEIEQLIHIENVYQEPSYGRKELAQELNISESLLSKIINQYFDKSVPHFLNGARVSDAQILLEQTDVAVKIVAEESGFNSLASFNRVFKDMTGETPSEFRKRKAA